MNNFSQRLKAIKLNISYYRRKCGMTQEQLADKLYISRTHLSNIEAPNTKTGITLELLFEIADIFEIDVVKLIEPR